MNAPLTKPIARFAVALLAAFALGAAPSAAAQSDWDGNTWRGVVTLQVRSWPNYSAKDVQMLLSDETYLGSVHPGLVPGENATFDVPGAPDGVTLLWASVPGGEIVSIDVQGRTRDAVEKAIAALLDNLSSIVPNQHAQARDRLEATQRTVADAEAALAELQNRHSAFIEKFGASDPMGAVERETGTLTRLKNELDALRLELATNQAARDFLAKAVETEPLTTEESHGPDLNLLKFRADLKELEAEMAQLMAMADPESPDVVRLQGKIDFARARIEQETARAQPQPNPRRIGLEADLFDAERQIAHQAGRVKVLEQTILELTESAKRSALVAGDWRQLQTELQTAQNDLTIAQSNASRAADIQRETSQGTWLQVVAGPQIGVSPVHE